MAYNENIFKYQYMIVKDFVSHLAYYRTAKSKLKNESLFWRHTANAHLEAAILDWCKVFGSKKDNATHWTKTPLKGNTTAEGKFREMILETTGFTKSEWEVYHGQMLDMRNKYVAHLEIEKIPTLPFLDKSLKVAFAYDKWVRELIESDDLNSPSLEKHYEKCKQELESIAKNI